MCLRWSTINKKDQSAIAMEDTNNRKKLNASERLAVKSFREIGSVLHVLKGSYGIHSPSRALSWQNHFFYVNSFYRSGLLKQRSMQTVG